MMHPLASNTSRLDFLLSRISKWQAIHEFPSLRREGCLSLNQDSQSSQSPLPESPFPPKTYQVVSQNRMLESQIDKNQISFKRETVTEENHFHSIQGNKLINQVDLTVLSNDIATMQQHGHPWTRFLERADPFYAANKL